MVDFSTLLYGPIYSTFGTDAVLDGPFDAEYALRVVDMTSGVEVAGQGPDVGTIRPAAVVRQADLVTLGLTADDLDNATLTMNGKAWSVKSSAPKPSPDGEAGGELYLFLMDADA